MAKDPNNVDQESPEDGEFGCAATQAMDAIDFDAQAATFVMDTSGIPPEEEEDELGFAATAVMDRDLVEQANAILEAEEHARKENARRTAVESPEDVQRLLTEAQKLAESRGLTSPTPSTPPRRTVAPTVAERAVTGPAPPVAQPAPSAPPASAPAPSAKANNTWLIVAIVVVALMILGGIGFLVIALAQ